MEILTRRGGIASTNCYLIADAQSKQAVLFDAPDNTVGPLLDQAKQRGWDVIGLWLTHGHFDHLADHAIVTQRFPDAKMLIHKLDEPKLIKPNRALFPLPFIIPPGKASGYIEDGEVLNIGSLGVQAIHTPGHSPGHVMFYFAEQGVLIGGDLIIMGAVGRTDFPDCDANELNVSIRKIMRLPRATRLLAGHGGPSTLAEEQAKNPFVQEALAEEE